MAHKRTNLNKLDRHVASKRRVASAGIGIIAPPRKNAAKSAFAAQRLRLDPATSVYKDGIKLTSIQVGW